MFTTNKSNLDSMQSSQRKNKEVILWADVETSGKEPESDCLLEIGMLITDMAGNAISDEYEALFEIKNLSKVIEKTDPIVQKMHEESGLWIDLWNKPTQKYLEVDESFSKTIGEVGATKECVYFGGNSITLDRNFMNIYLPKVYSQVSHRSIDVTSLSLALQSNTRIPGYEKGKTHRAMQDVYDSVEEYKHYLKWVSR